MVIRVLFKPKFYYPLIRPSEQPLYRSCAFLYFVGKTVTHFSFGQSSSYANFIIHYCSIQGCIYKLWTKKDGQRLIAKQTSLRQTRLNKHDQLLGDSSSLESCRKVTTNTSKKKHPKIDKRRSLYNAWYICRVYGKVCVHHIPVSWKKTFSDL